MKINYGNERTGVPIKSLVTGSPFLKERKSAKERGLYMKIDMNSGLCNRKLGFCYAVNLETGQLREFGETVLVDKVNAEIIFT